MYNKIFLSAAIVMLISLHCLSQSRPVRAQLIRGPYLQAATSNSIIIRWRTNVLGRSRVRYGTIDGKLDNKVYDSFLVTEHVIKIKDLQPATKYFYSVGDFKDSLQGNSDNFFYTLPEPGTNGFYRIGVFGDCGNNSPNQLKVRDEFQKYLGNNYMNAWLLLGDNAYTTGTDLEYQTNFFDIYKDGLLKKYPLYPSPGNHDYYDMSLSPKSSSNELSYFRNFSMPVNGEAGGVPSHNPSYYSYDIGNVHLISLDAHGRQEKTFMYDTLGPQARWLKEDLEKNKKEWIIAYWHLPPYSMASHNSDKETAMVIIREKFIRILERYNVDLVLCGHSHAYERSRLMKGYYGMEADYKPGEHNVSSSSGLYNDSANSCPYIKNGNNAGTVYVVSGSAGSLGGKQDSFPHNAMYYSNASIGGAAILEIQGNRLDLKWICADGVIRDHFTMMKNVNRRNIIKVKKGESVTLTASYEGRYKWTNSNLTTKSIVITPAKRKSTFTVQDDAGCLKDTFEIEVN